LSSEPIERRRALAEGIGIALNAYVRSGLVLDPTRLAASVLETLSGAPADQGTRQPERQEAELRAMAGEIRKLRARFEGGRLAVYLDRETTLELIERMLRKTFATQEAAATATFRSDPLPAGDSDGELVLPNRSIYVKLIPQGSAAAEFAASYVERARLRNPSEYWLFALSQETLDIPFEPVFAESRITRGRLRIMGLTSLIREIVGADHDVTAAYDGEGFRFVIGEKRTAVPAA